MSPSNVLEQWCYWIKYSREHSQQELQTLLPELAFLKATRELVGICERTEERQMYDSREKAALDFQSGLIDAKEEGREEGEIKLIRTLQEILGEPLTEEADFAGHSFHVRLLNS